MFYLPKSQLQLPPKLVDWPQFYRQQARKARHPAIKQFYQQGIVASDTPLEQVPFAALDFETTGLNPGRDSIVSIGVVPFTLQRITLPAARHWLVNPRQRMPEATIVVHGITEANVANQPDLLGILPMLLELLAGRVVVAHHSTIERLFLNQAVKRRMYHSLMFPMVDTMAIESNLCRHGWRDFWLRLTGRPRASIRLAASRSRYGLPMYRPHHAQTDALATAELFQAQVRYHFEADAPIGSLWQ
ncbi:3'-5' exonuclease [Celerinatantimonas yamalensis]|uniref:3'-5' exonuclease n=1 Tax=Celerinatantimonas yamalensis TaxID=559956 RepID=A0ABW9G1I8_9GAMM